MASWLSSTWGPSWRSFQYFNLYRLVVALVLLGSAIIAPGWVIQLGSGAKYLFGWVSALYLFYVACGLTFSIRWKRRFNFQLTLQVLGDTLALSVITYSLGGVSSGGGLLLLVSLTAASLVGRGHLVLFYAALATLGMLLTQVLVILKNDLDAASGLQAGLLSAGFFATAILARLLGQRIMLNEELARQRGVALENEIRIGESIIERMQDGVLVVDAQGVVVRHNPGALALLGVEDLEGRSLVASSGPLDVAYQRWKLSPLGNDEAVMEMLSGNPLRARFVSPHSAGGEVLIFLEDLRRVRGQAQQLKLASLGRLTASIAHEIRNPLAAISHATDLLHEERRGEIHERLLRIVQDNVFRLDRIVQDVLKLGRSDRAQPEMLALSVFLADFLEEFQVVENVDAGVIQLDCLDATICFDRSQLLQVLWNLLANALQHSQRLPGSVRLQVLLNADRQVELHVTDDGPGVPEELRDQIFEPFFTTRHQGMGLGLFITRELCEANGAALQLMPSTMGAHFVILGGAQCPLPEASDVSAAN